MFSTDKNFRVSFAIITKQIKFSILITSFFLAALPVMPTVFSPIVLN